jgi:mono/diheme cytochrome c family protein
MDTKLRWMRALAAAITLFSLQACEQGMKDMYSQDKYKPLAPAQSWPDGRSSRPLTAGTVPYSAGVAAGTSSGIRGEEPLSQKNHADYSLVNLQRGRQRYEIFCAPCHGASGDGDGYIVRRGFPKPPSYHGDRLRSVPDAYLEEVIDRGHGAMYGYGDRIDEADRWAIVGYLRALQLSQNARLEDVSPAERALLKESAR